MILTNAGAVLSSEDKKRLIAEKNAYFQQHNRAKLLEGIADAIDSMKRRSMKIGLVTGTVPKNIDAVLTQDFQSEFDIIVTANDTERGKPYGDPYLAGVRKLGVEKEVVVAIENAPAGIASAKAAGLQCVALKTTLTDEFLQEADLTLDDATALADLFAL